MTGAQACLILYNLSGCDYKGESQAFADADSIPAWAREPLDAMVGEGILSLSDYKGADMSMGYSSACLVPRIGFCLIVRTSLPKVQQESIKKAFAILRSGTRLRHESSSFIGFR